MRNYNESIWSKNIFTDEEYKNFITNVEVDNNEIGIHLGDNSIKKVPYSKSDYDKYINIMKEQVEKGKSLLSKIKTNRLRLIACTISLFIIMIFSIMHCVETSVHNIKYIIDLISSILFGALGSITLKSVVISSKDINDIEKNAIFLTIEDSLKETIDKDPSIFLGLSRESKNVILDSKPIHVGFDNIEKLSLEDLKKLRENLTSIQKEERSSNKPNYKRHVLMPIPKIEQPK